MGRTAGEASLAHLAGCWIEIELVNALAIALRVSADVDAHD